MAKFSVITTGGKQYKVSVGDKIKVEKLEAPAGGNVSFEKVLLVADGEKVEVGTPYLSGRGAPGARAEKNRVQIPLQNALSEEEGAPPAFYGG